MASNASKWGCDVPSCNCMLEMFSPGKAIDMIKLHIESTHGLQLPPWCESMEDETQVMMKEGGYPSVKWDPSQVERDVPEGSFVGKYRDSAFCGGYGITASDGRAPNVAQHDGTARGCAECDGGW